jgi:hypothetical protein
MKKEQKLITTRQKPLRKLIASALLIGFSGATDASDQYQKDINKDSNANRLMSIETLSGQAFVPDFSYAGYQNGLTALPEADGIIIDVGKFGAQPNDGKDDSAAVQRAIDAANKIEEPVVIRFDAGTYLITSILKVTRSDFVLQGQGAGAKGTELHFPRPLRHIDASTSLDELRTYIRQLNKRQREPELNIDEYFSEYSWSGGFIWVQPPNTRPAPYLEEFDTRIDALSAIKAGMRGQRKIVLSSASSIKAGQIIQLQWINRTGPDASILKSIYGTDYRLAGSHHWTFKERPLVRQTVRVENIEGDTVTLADELLHDVNEGQPAQVALWQGLVNIGIEDMHLSFPDSPSFGHHLEEGYNGIYFTGAFDSWARNLKVSNADSALLSYNSANLTFDNIVTDGSRTAHYAVHMGNVHNVIAKNLRIFNPVRHSLTFNTQSTKCVYHNAEVFIAPVLDQHAGANHQNLFDTVTVHAPAQNRGGRKVIPIYNGSGAGYWQPGHGGYNTTWNLKVLVSGGAHPGEKVILEGVDEGPMALIVGVHGNREFGLDYRPQPLLSVLNKTVSEAPSLYKYQLRKRLNALQMRH